MLQWILGLLVLIAIAVATLSYLYPYDAFMVWTLIRGLLIIKPLIRKNFTVDSFWYKHYDQRTEGSASETNSVNRVAFFSIDEGQGYSWKQVEAESNRVARYLQNKGLVAGDKIALVMQNHPRYIWTWLGAAKIGATSALINYNLRGHALHHAINLSGAKLIFFDAEFSEALKEVSEDLRTSLPHSAHYSYLGDSGTFGESYTTSSAHLSQDRLPASQLAQNLPNVKTTHPVFYIYTSGTTGPAKAAKISHFRFFGAGYLPALFWNITSADRIYTPLPLYHFAGGVMGVSPTISSGACLYMRKKFSVSRFTEDCIEHKITVIQYIGELCRYLMNIPEKPNDSKTSIRLAYGNGLRPDVWPKFKKRYAIKQIAEFYGATESPAMFFNLFDKEGSMGYCSPFIQRLFNVKLVQYDLETDQVVRGPDGLCRPVPSGGVGELIAVAADKRAIGYTNDEATEKKMLRNVFKHGDEWFRSGDLVKIDAGGWASFVDRLGDTFRWKGENVATSDVEDVMTRFEHNGKHVLEEVTSYGVQIPNTDGRAGMACIRYPGDMNTFPWEEFTRYVTKSLPSYAVPIFLRFTSELPVTGTWKYSKNELKRQGFDVNNHPSEPFFYLDHSSKKYIPLDAKVYQDIQSGAKQF